MGIGGSSIAGKISLMHGKWATHMDIQTLVLTSVDARFEYVEFKLSYNGLETAECIPSNASAADVEAALLSAPINLASNCGPNADRSCVSVARYEMKDGEFNAYGGSTVTYTFGFDAWNSGIPDENALSL